MSGISLHAELASVLPMTEPGPNAGGAQTHQSLTELTEESWLEFKRRRTDKVHSYYMHSGSLRSDLLLFRIGWCLLDLLQSHWTEDELRCTARRLGRSETKKTTGWVEHLTTVQNQTVRW
jgi:hypothetical protein